MDFIDTTGALECERESMRNLDEIVRALLSECAREGLTMAETRSVLRRGERALNELPLGVGFSGYIELLDESNERLSPSELEELAELESRLKRRRQIYRQL